MITFVVPLLILAAAPPAAADFTLADAAGTPWRLHAQSAKAVAVVFLAADCPMSNGYAPTLAEIAKAYAEKGVVVVGVNPSPDETAATVADHAKEYKLPFPVFHDPKGVSVKALAPKVTPEVVVLDANHVVRYRGRLDDGYAARMKPKAGAGRDDLKIALDELLAGTPVSKPETKAFGCPVPPPAAEAAAATAVTYYKDVVPVLQTHCQGCHRPGQVGPFALTNYKQAARWAETSLEEIHAKRMPPWKPAPNANLANERTLPAAATATLEAWVKQGLPEGDPKDAPPAAKFSDDWLLGEPDLVLEVPAGTTIGAGGKDHFRVVVLPTNLPEDKYIVAMDVRPGNPRVVHHTLQLIDTTGKGRKLQAAAAAKADPTAADRGPGYEVGMGWGFTPDRANMCGGWAPGLLPKKLPAGVGQKLPKGADVCVQFHYHRTGKVETDRTKIGIYFAKDPPKQAYRSIPVAGLFSRIPAGDSAFVVENVWKAAEDLTVYRYTPHMHLLGKDIELFATKPGGKEESLVRIPAWDYNWQEQYELKAPLKLPAGTKLRVRATYDNSAANPHNPNSPPAPVRLGEQTTNEMCFVFLGVSTTSSAQRLLTPQFGLRWSGDAPATRRAGG